MKGIDVSENNGIVDWHAVKAAGMEFAIIRLGYGNNHLDSCFYHNINGAVEAGLKIGVYYYSYALDVDAAKSEARFVTAVLDDAGLKPHMLSMGIWVDMEDADGYKANHGMPSNQTITDMCSAFICEMNSYGYWCGVYASYDWLRNRIDTKQLAEYVPYWCAQWGNQCDWPDARMWQYTDSYNIDGQLFDGNVAY